LDQLTEIQSALPVFAPMIAFMIGLTGSVHCIGMCGGLVLTVGSDFKSNSSYQLGRLSAYLLMALIAMFTSTLIQSTGIGQYVPMIGGVFIGLLFTFWGLQSIRGRKFEVKLPKFLSSLYKTLFSKFSKNNNSKILKGYSVGALSLLLPCGFLYAVLITLMTFQSPLIGFLGVIGFWLGTLPAMVFAPTLINQVIKPIAKYAPKFSGALLIVLGLSTVSYRLWTFYTTGPYCH
jgi:sulfite exporter TauE/SafE